MKQKIMKITMTKINEIWLELTEKNKYTSGFVFRRYSSEIIPDIYVGLHLPENYKSIFVKTNNKQIPDLKSFANFRDIEVLFQLEKPENETGHLIIGLRNNEFEDIFSVLCEDLIFSVKEEKDEKKLIKNIITRLSKWQEIFEKSSQGLNNEQKRGLFGELFLLNELLSICNDKFLVINSWQGSEGADQDFINSGKAIEIKTSKQQSHQKINISNIYQLDEENLKSLVLCHYIVNENKENGTSLIELIETIKTGLSKEVMSVFNRKLIEIGCFPHPLNLYELPKYMVSSERFYNVADEFPRIKQNEIRNGVENVRYLVNPDGFGDYMVDKEKVLKQFISE